MVFINPKQLISITTTPQKELPDYKWQEPKPKYIFGILETDEYTQPGFVHPEHKKVIFSEEEVIQKGYIVIDKKVYAAPEIIVETTNNGKFRYFCDSVQEFKSIENRLKQAPGLVNLWDYLTKNTPLNNGSN